MFPSWQWYQRRRVWQACTECSGAGRLYCETAQLNHYAGQWPEQSLLILHAPALSMRGLVLLLCPMCKGEKKFLIEPGRTLQRLPHHEVSVVLRQWQKVDRNLRVKGLLPALACAVKVEKIT